MGFGYLNSYSYSYNNIINAQAAVVLKTGSGVLHSVVVNTLGTTPTIQLWDNTAASGNKIGFITPTAPGTFLYDATFNTGLTVTTTGTVTADITVNYG
jgi:hypothetical protein